MTKNNTHYKALVYAGSTSQEAITITQLKNNDIDETVDVTAISNRCDKQGISFGLRDDAASYPPRLHHVPSAPYFVSMYGDPSCLHRKMIGIVGPRKPTAYGEQVTKEFIDHLLPYKDIGATISGGADGIDSICHTHSLHNDIPTIAVLGGGLGHYRSHSRYRSLMDSIVDKGGLVISEFPLHHEPRSYTFPQRNRIIAGLAHALIVPQAGRKSGTLVTLDHATRAHVPIYGFPASIYDETAAGLLDRMAQGAVHIIADCATCIQTILGDPPHHTASTAQASLLADTTLSPLQQSILEHIVHHGPVSLDRLADHISCSPTDLLSDIMMLTIQGHIHESGPQTYSSK